MTSYDEKLKNEVPFYKAHEEYLPFIGKYYSEDSPYKILQIGESHFLGYEKGSKIKKTLFDGWWDGDLKEELKGMKDSWFTTRKVLENYINDNSTKSHGIFDNILKEFESVVLKSDSHNRDNYNYFSFMNFYQMPSPNKGINYTKAIYSNFGEDKGNEIWYRCAAESIKVVDKVIEILKPKLIVFTSKEAYTYYKKYAEGCDYKNNIYVSGKYSNDPRIKYVCHPGSAWWNKKRKNKKTYREEFDEYLKEVFR